MTTRSLPPRKAKPFRSVSSKAAPPVAAAIGENPINIITNRLGHARAAADLLISLTASTDGGGVGELDEMTLNCTFWDILDRIDEAQNSADDLHDKYVALLRTAEKAFS